MHKVRFPKVSANVDEAVLTAWLKSEGDEVGEGETLAELTTDKGVIELESPCSGTLCRLAAPENSTLPVGYIVALVGDPGEPVPEVDRANESLLKKHRKRLSGTAGKHRQVNKGRRSRVRATPAARRLAREYDLKLEAVLEVADGEVVDRQAVENYLAEPGKNGGTGGPK